MKRRCSSPQVCRSFSIRSQLGGSPSIFWGHSAVNRSLCDSFLSFVTFHFTRAYLEYEQVTLPVRSVLHRSVPSRKRDWWDHGRHRLTSQVPTSDPPEPPEPVERAAELAEPGERAAEPVEPAERAAERAVEPVEPEERAAAVEPQPADE